MPALVIRQFRFVGFDRDVVGQGRSARPNGERDGHFSVVLAAPKGTRSVVWLAVERCDPSGKKNFCGMGLKAETSIKGGSHSRQPTPSLLAVFAGGKRMNIAANARKSWLRLPGSGKGVRLDLFINDGPGCVQAPGCFDHRFAPGQRFRLIVLYRPGSTPRFVQSATIGPRVTISGPKAGPNTPPVALRSVRYLGLGQDAVGRTPGSPPNGEPDAHWQIEFATPTGPAYLWNVLIERFVADPNEPLPRMWASVGGGHKWLAVFLGETRLKLEASDQSCGFACEPENMLDLHWSAKAVRLDLYANDQPPGAFKPGQRFRVIVLAQMPPWVKGAGSRGAQSDWLTLP